MRFAVLPLAFMIAAVPAAAQIGINGTRQAAGSRDVEIVISPLSRCGRSSRAAVIAAAGSGPRSVERERLAMDERRLRYAGGGLTEAEEALLEARARQLEADSGRAWRYSSYERGARRRHGAGMRDHHRGRC